MFTSILLFIYYFGIKINSEDKLMTIIKERKVLIKILVPKFRTLIYLIQ